MNEESSLARNNAKCAMSSPSPHLLTGHWSIICYSAAGPPILSTIAVWINPGAIPLHLISGPNSHAMDLVSPIIACLLLMEMLCNIILIFNLY